MVGSGTAQIDPIEAKRHRDALAALLAERGLEVEMSGRLLSVRNRAAEVDDLVGRSLSPGLSQSLALLPHDDHGLWWHFLWSGPTRDAQSETEPMCPADNIEYAADTIARVLALNGQGAS